MEKGLFEVLNRECVSARRFTKEINVLWYNENYRGKKSYKDVATQTSDTSVIKLRDKYVFNEDIGMDKIKEKCSSENDDGFVSLTNHSFSSGKDVEKCHIKYEQPKSIVDKNDLEKLIRNIVDERIQEYRDIRMKDESSKKGNTDGSTNGEDESSDLNGEKYNRVISTSNLERAHESVNDMIIDDHRYLLVCMMEMMDER